MGEGAEWVNKYLLVHYLPIQLPWKEPDEGGRQWRTARPTRRCATSAAGFISRASRSARSPSTATAHGDADGQHAVLQHDAQPAAAAHRPALLRAGDRWGQPLMNSLLTLGLMIGMQVADMTVGTTIANLGMQDVKFRHPVFEGDTLQCTTEVFGKRESKSRPGAGIVEFHHRAFNQDNKLVAECQRQAFIKMRPK